MALFRTLSPLIPTPVPLPVALPVILPSVTLPLILTPLPSPEALPVMVLVPVLLRLPLMLTPAPFTPLPLTVALFRTLSPLIPTPTPLTELPEMVTLVIVWLCRFTPLPFVDVPCKVVVPFNPEAFMATSLNPSYSTLEALIVTFPFPDIFHFVFTPSSPSDHPPIPAAF